MPWYCSSGKRARATEGRWLQQHVPDILRVVVIAVRQSLDDVALGLMGAEREGLGLRQGELAMGQGLFRLVAQARKGQAALDGRGAQAGLGGELLQREALLHQPGKRRCFFQGRQILPLDVFHRGEA